jgi:hypothetical protein
MEEDRHDEIIAAREELLGIAIDPYGERFTDMGNGTVRDNGSGLIWTKDCEIALGAAHPVYGYYMVDWWEAMNEVYFLSSGEHGISDGSVNGDWRLPTRNEFLALFDYSFIDPAISNGSGDARWSEGDLFLGDVVGNYWTSSEFDYDSAYIAWTYSGQVVNYGIERYSDNKYGIERVWPVRDARPSEMVP